MIVKDFDMDWEMYFEGYKMKVLLMVLWFGYCLNDLLYCWWIGGLLIEIVGVVLNYMDY